MDASSTSTTATYRNPFHFGLQTVQVAVNSVMYVIGNTLEAPTR